MHLLGEGDVVTQSQNVLLHLTGGARAYATYNNGGNEVALDPAAEADEADEAALAAYKADPLYAESIARVRHLRDLRVVADYVVEDAVIADRRG